MKELHASWGRKVRSGREAMNLSQRRLAHICGVDTSTISRIERGLLAPRDGLKWKLAGALGKSVEDLFAYPAVRPPMPEAVA